LDQVDELIDKRLSPLQAFERFAAPETEVKNPSAKMFFSIYTKYWKTT